MTEIDISELVVALIKRGRDAFFEKGSAFSVESFFRLRSTLASPAQDTISYEPTVRSTDTLLLNLAVFEQRLYLSLAPSSGHLSLFSVSSFARPFAPAS